MISVRGSGDLKKSVLNFFNVDLFLATEFRWAIKIPVIGSVVIFAIKFPRQAYHRQRGEDSLDFLSLPSKHD